VWTDAHTDAQKDTHSAEIGHNGWSERGALSRFCRPFDMTRALVCKPNRARH
jgi:hypothetical protein